jgi:hypothetical protein
MKEMHAAAEYTMGLYFLLITSISISILGPDLNATTTAMDDVGPTAMMGCQASGREKFPVWLAILEKYWLELMQEQAESFQYWLTGRMHPMGRME